MKMSNIAVILENVMIEDDTQIVSNDDELIQEYYLSEAIKHKKVSLTNIIKWESQLAKFICSLHLKGISLRHICIEDLMVDTNLNIVGDTIRFSYSKFDELVEVTAIKAIMDMHKAIFEHLLHSYTTKNQKKRHEILYAVANFHYVGKLNLRSRTTVNDFLRCIDEFYCIVNFGLINELFTLINI